LNHAAKKIYRVVQWFTNFVDAMSFKQDFATFLNFRLSRKLKILSNIQIGTQPAGLAKGVARHRDEKSLFAARNA